MQTETTVRHTKCGRMRGMVVGEGGHSSGVLLYKYSFYPGTIIRWNLLPIHVHEAVTVDAFKALVPVTVLAPIYHV